MPYTLYMIYDTCR